MWISIEVPVFKGQFLQPCIDSVLTQTSDAWTLTLVWDGGDSQSREILKNLACSGDPRIRVYFTPNQGIARARAFLSNHTDGAYILPLDDDDILAPNAVEHFLNAAQANPWASLIRGRRTFIDIEGNVIEQEQWFPFGQRNYYKGMVTDLFNQTQPYLIRRSAYERTQGWRGFSDFLQAGEDCDIFLQLEEVAHFELVEETLYYYRLHDQRASDVLTPAAAFEMWRRLADEALQRMGLPLIRNSEMPPFQYEPKEQPAMTLSDVDFVIRNNNERAAVALRRCGIQENAIIQAPLDTDSRTWKMAGFRATKRSLVCFVDYAVDIETPSALIALINALNQTGGDLLAPHLGMGGEYDKHTRLIRPATVGLDGMNVSPHDAWHRESIRNDASDAPWLFGEFLLVRREVILSTGGFDEHYVPLALQDVDFCIQARRRGFNCVEVPVAGIYYLGPPEANWTMDDTALLRKKWHSHEFLL